MGVSRRKLMAGMGFGGAALAMGAAPGMGLDESPRWQSLPWPYVELEPDAVAERAYAGYYKANCMFGAFEGVIGELSRNSRDAYDFFPCEMMRHGSGGVAGWATLCGALNGAAAIYLVSRDPDPVIDEVFSWHNLTSLPDYAPRNPKFAISPSVAGSTLCHISISNWAKASGKKAFSKERSERCAWITACVARYTVMQLNRQAAGVFTVLHPIPKEVQDCRACHDRGGTGENTRGKMFCGQCHKDIGKDHP